MAYPFEKTVDQPRAQSVKAKQRNSFSRLEISLLAACCLGACFRFVSIPNALPTILRPSASLYTQGSIAWETCTDLPEFHCGYLTVPLDWTGKHYPDELMHLALRKWPATAAPDQRLGSMLMNPGGPGGSGHAAVATYGKSLSFIVEGRYDIIGFDPRGVNLSYPGIDCFANADIDTHLAYDNAAVGTFRSASHGLPSNARTAAELKYLRRYDAYTQAAVDACTFHGNQKVLRSVSTSFVARDMKRLVEELGESKLVYWGFSYGSILGATFAAMFPDMVHRLVIDGVADAKLYTNSIYDWGRSSMVRSKETFHGFFSNCAAAGPERCAFAKQNSTVKELYNRYENIIESLAFSPLPAANSSIGVGVVDASDLEQLLFATLYKPAKWPYFAQTLADLETGNATLLFESQLQPWLDEAKHPRNKFPSPFHPDADGTARQAIIMGDTAKLPISSLNDELEYTRELADLSPIGSLWSSWVHQARRWRFEPVEAYRGPWTKEEGLNDTAHPILVVSNTFDPVTPLDSAGNTQRRFGKSASLLIQNAYGHCSTAQPSKCVVKHIREYFVDGILPVNGTTCDSDPGSIFPSSMKAEASAEDDELAHHLRILRDNI